MIYYKVNREKIVIMSSDLDVFNLSEIARA